jgi:methyltransferase (TIGR00027 family)
VQDGAPSITAARVAARRLTFERLPAPFGDPAADERLARAVAESAPPAAHPPGDLMAGYLRGRTAFFDRTVVNALERGVSQIAIVGAGYDGRALRYAKPGVRWFEVDHPATQEDKRGRLESLGIEAAAVTYAPVDLTAPGADAGAALRAGGWYPDAPSLMLCEGLSVYLPVDALQRLLAGLRAVASVGARLAISFSVAPTSPEQRDRRARFRAAVEALGEPARNDVDSDMARPRLAAARWRPVEISPRAQAIGLVVAAPVWEPARDGGPPTAGRIAVHLERTYSPPGLDGLAAHLAGTYGIAVTATTPLDVGVLRVERSDGPPWVARVMRADRSLEHAGGDAAILRGLEEAGFPAERCAAPEPVTMFNGQAVLVTEWIAGRAAARRAATFTALGDALGRLHRAGEALGVERPGGGWHHLVTQGGPADELAAAGGLLAAAADGAGEGARAALETLRSALAGADPGADLPVALIHPDPVPVNAIDTDGGLVLVDWTGAGQGPRLWPLAFLLWAASMSGPNRIDAVMDAHRRQVELSEAERERLAAVITARPLVLAAWGVISGRTPRDEAADAVLDIHERAAAIAARALRGR